jgi:N-hydroxyarylamine O-acetyltransferase
MDRQKYLQRIGLGATEIPVDVDGLRLLQRRHLLTVPFENLDIHWKRPIVLDTKAFYRKIVVENRGGFCYELNGLFNELLRDLGFETRLVSARVGGNEDGTFSPEYDHLAIIVKIDGEEYLADVGFGDFIAEPLKLELDLEQKDATGIFRIRDLSYENTEYLLVEKKNGEAWKSEDIFTGRARALSEFAAMCEFHQTSADSHFMKNKICSLMTEIGRKTLTNNKFIETEDGARTEITVESESQFNEILEREFGIEPNPRYDRLHFLQ